MDDPRLDARRHEAALAGLGRLHALSGTARTLWGVLAELARGRAHPLHVLDVGTGDGAIPIALARRARDAGLDLRLEGRDRSALAIARARERARRAGVDVRFAVEDALGPAPRRPSHDVVICSLLAHHFDEAGARRLLAGMALRAREMVLVHDLVRSRAGWWLARVVPPLLCRSPVVRVDALRSVEGAFTPDEIAALAREAGLHDVSVRRHWPERVLLRARP